MCVRLFTLVDKGKLIMDWPYGPLYPNRPSLTPSHTHTSYSPANALFCHSFVVDFCTLAHSRAIGVCTLLLVLSWCNYALLYSLSYC